jgi:hypothetical protein
MTRDEQRAYWRAATAKFRAKNRERLRAEALARTRKKREADPEGVRAHQRETTRRWRKRQKVNRLAQERLARKQVLKLEAAADGRLPQEARTEDRPSLSALPPQ